MADEWYGSGCQEETRRGQLSLGQLVLDQDLRATRCPPTCPALALQ